MEEKSFQNTQKLEEILINKDSNEAKKSNMNVNSNNLNTSNNSIKKYEYDINVLFAWCRNRKNKAKRLYFKKAIT